MSMFGRIVASLVSRDLLKRVFLAPLDFVARNQVVGLARQVPTSDRRSQRDRFTLLGYMPLRRPKGRDHFTATSAAAFMYRASVG